MANGSDARVAYVAESTFGTTPATPTFKIMRVTKTGMKSTKQTVTSEEIRQDRNVVDLIQTGISASGSLPFEFSHASFDDMIEAALCGTWSSNVISNGTTRRSFTFEETFTMPDASSSFHRFLGCTINSLSLSLAARAKITGSIGIMGITESAPATTAISGSTYTAANSEPIMEASGDVGTLTFGSLTTQIRSLNIEIDNGARERPVVGSLTGIQHGLGQASVSGTVEAYFRNTELYAAALSHSNVAITATIGIDTNKKYTILIPRAVFGSAERKAAGNTDDVMVTVPFTGTLSSGRSIQITRVVA